MCCVQVNMHAHTIYAELGFQVPHHVRARRGSATFIMVELCMSHCTMSAQFARVREKLGIIYSYIYCPRYVTYVCLSRDFSRACYLALLYLAFRAPVFVPFLNFHKLPLPPCTLPKDVLHILRVEGCLVSYVVVMSFVAIMPHYFRLPRLQGSSSLQSSYPEKEEPV